MVARSTCSDRQSDVTNWSSRTLERNASEKSLLGYAEGMMPTVMCRIKITKSYGVREYNNSERRQKLTEEQCSDTRKPARRCAIREDCSRRHKSLRRVGLRGGTRSRRPVGDHSLPERCVNSASKVDRASLHEKEGTLTLPLSRWIGALL